MFVIVLQISVCVCVRVRACVRARVCVYVCVMGGGTEQKLGWLTYVARKARRENFAH